MKFIFTMILLATFTKACKSNSAVATGNQLTEIERKALEAQDLPTISYETSTRGFYERLWIEDETFYMTSDREEEQVESVKMDAETILDIKKMLMNLSLDQLSSYEAPTDLRHGDAARMATLTIVTDEQTYESQTFDHGHPPQAIEALVNKVLSIREMIEK